MTTELTDDQVRWLLDAARNAGDRRTARACYAMIAVSGGVSEWTKETASAHCSAVFAGIVQGAQLCREMMASFVGHQGLTDIAASIRANWNPAWGADPGAPKQAPEPHRCAGYTNRA